MLIAIFEQKKLCKLSSRLVISKIKKNVSIYGTFYLLLLCEFKKLFRGQFWTGTSGQFCSVVKQFWNISVMIVSKNNGQNRLQTGTVGIPAEAINSEYKMHANHHRVTFIWSKRTKKPGCNKSPIANNKCLALIESKSKSDKSEQASFNCLPTSGISSNQTTTAQIRIRGRKEKLPLISIHREKISVKSDYPPPVDKSVSRATTAATAPHWWDRLKPPQDWFRN